MVTTPSRNSRSATSASSAIRRVLVERFAEVVNSDEQPQFRSELRGSRHAAFGNQEKRGCTLCHLPSADRFTPNPMPPLRFSLGVNRSRFPVSMNAVFFKSITQVTDFGMSRFVPQPASAIAASGSFTPPVAPSSSSGLGNASSPAADVDVEADGEAPDFANNPFSTPPDARGGSGSSSSSSRADAGQANTFESTSAHATIEEGSRGGAEGRGNGTGAGRTKRTAGKGDIKDDGGSWGLRGATRWGRKSLARGTGTGTTPAGSSPRNSESAAGEVEGKGELGLTTNLGTVAWAAPEMLGADGSRGEYTAKVGGVRWEMGNLAFVRCTGGLWWRGLGVSCPWTGV